MKKIITVLMTIGIIEFCFATYDPEIGKFLSRDPIGGEDGPNEYAICGNDTINNNDLLGLLTLHQAAWLTIIHRPAGTDNYIGPGVMLCLLWKESSFNPAAKNNRSSAIGIAQILSGTANDIQDRVGPRRYGIKTDPFYTLRSGERFVNHRTNAGVSVYAAYMYLHDGTKSTGDWKKGVNRYGPNAQKVVNCANSCAIKRFDTEGMDYLNKCQKEVWNELYKIHK